MILTRSQNLGILVTRLILKARKLFFLTFSLGFYQIINEPTYILHNSSSCIDLIFTTQRNLVKESCVYSSLHASCHYQLPYVKFNLNVFYHSLMKEKCGIINLRILIAFSGKLKILTGKRHFSMLMLRLFNETILLTLIILNKLKKSFFLTKLKSKIIKCKSSTTSL